MAIQRCMGELPKRPDNGHPVPTIGMQLRKSSWSRRPGSPSSPASSPAYAERQL